jgi:CRP/FNR family transcriptional regulator, cyclic AMP receptor protein
LRAERGEHALGTTLGAAPRPALAYAAGPTRDVAFVNAHAAHAETVRRFLQRNTVLGRLPEAALNALADRGQQRRYAKREVIYRRGEPSDSLMVVMTGRVKLLNTNASGRQIVLHFLVPGNIYGEIGALDGKERAATAMALEDSDIFLVYTRDLIPAVRAHPDAMFGIIEALCEKVRAGAALIEDSTLEMRGRAARGLLRLAEQHGQKRADGICVQLALSQEELGNYWGLSRPNVSRVLGELREADVIKIDSSQIIIMDETGLTELAASGSSKD